MHVSAETVADLVETSGWPGAAAGSSFRGRRVIVCHGVSDVRTGRGVRPDTAFRIASLTKPITAAATVLAFEDRGLPLETPLLDLLPALERDWNAEGRLSAAQVLGQVSGLRESVDASEMATLGEGDGALLEGARRVVRAGQEETPGRRWSYYNGNYVLAGAALAALTEATYEDAVDRMVLTPWSLTRTTFHPPAELALGHVRGTAVDQTTYPRSRRPSGGLWSTIGDLLGFGECLMRNAGLLRAVRAAATPEASSMRYGLGWALGPSGQMFVNGRLTGYRAVMIVVAEHDHVAVALVNDEHALPGIAQWISDLQHPLTGDDLADAIDSFAA